MKSRQFLAELLQFTLMLRKMLFMSVERRRVTSSCKTDCLPAQGRLLGRETVTPYSQAVPLVAVFIGIPAVPRIHCL